MPLSGSLLYLVQSIRSPLLKRRRNAPENQVIGSQISRSGRKERQKTERRTKDAHRTPAKGRREHTLADAPCGRGHKALPLRLGVAYRKRRGNGE